MYMYILVATNDIIYVYNVWLSLSPVSSRCSSVNDCSELLAALEALTTELQAVEARNVETSIPGPAEDDFVKVTLDGIEEAPNDDKKNLRSLDLAEKERLLTECKNQIQVSDC